MSNFLSIIISIILSLSVQRVVAQSIDSLENEAIQSQYEGIAAALYIDSITITASKSGFNIEDFIKMILKDESFYNSFQALRLNAHTLEHSITFYDKKNRKRAYYEATNRQNVEDSCRIMKAISSSHQGNYYKRRRKQRYYTSTLFDKIFIPTRRICSVGKYHKEPSDLSAIGQHIHMMKRVIFSPGIEVDMPLVGKKMAIFSEEMQPYYDYSIRSEIYKDSIDCYVFDVNVKAKYKENNRKTIVRQLTTYFDKETLGIVARSYQMKYKNMLYQFDIDIDVELLPYKDGFIPTYIKYDGYWDLLLKPRETAVFEAKFYDFGKASAE